MLPRETIQYDPEKCRWKYKHVSTIWNKKDKLETSEAIYKRIKLYFFFILSEGGEKEIKRKLTKEKSACLRLVRSPRKSCRLLMIASH